MHMYACKLGFSSCNAQKPNPIVKVCTCLDIYTYGYMDGYPSTAACCGCLVTSESQFGCSINGRGFLEAILTISTVALLLCNISFKKDD